MSKKKVFLISIIVLLIATIGFFYFFGEKIVNYIENKEFERLFAVGEDYSFQNNSEGNYLINKKDGLSLKIPENWKVATGTSSLGFPSEKDTTLFSPDFNLRPPKGCMITIEITRAKNDKERGGFIMPTVEELNETIQSSKNSSTTEGYPFREIIIVNQRESLKEAYPPHEGVITIKYMHISVPTEDKVYSFDFVSSTEECDKEFDNLLKTILIQ
jgi:hypothetical protein